MADAVLASDGDERYYDEVERQAPVVSRKSAQEVDPSDPGTWGKVARNAPCPCGSGQKYKRCHGKHG